MPDDLNDNVVIIRDQMISMRDGVRLATDIVLPARAGKALPGPFPTLFHRTPYGKNLARASEISVARPKPKTNLEIAIDLAREGFASLVQDCRGRYGSEGVFRKYLGEGEDGFDTLAWAREQPWCDGRFGTYGLSYSAHTQTALAALKPEGLTAMFIDSGGFWNAWDGGVRRGGAFELKQATWAFKHAQLSPAAAADPVAAAGIKAERIEDWFEALRGGMPWRKHHSPLRHVPEYEDYLLEQWQKGTFDDFWKLPELYAAAHYPALAKSAVFLISGWFDPYSETMLRHYQGIRAQGGYAELVMGPWLHGRRSQTFAGDVDFGPNSVLDGQIAPDYDSLRIDWFKRFLGGIAAEAEPHLQWFAMGGGSGAKTAEGRLEQGGSWRSAAAWPPEGALTRQFWLGAGELCDQPQTGHLLLQSDPHNPVPSCGGQITSGEPVMLGGAFDQIAHEGLFAASTPFLPLAARPDVLSFASQPLEKPLEIAGPVVLELEIETDVLDTDLAFKLVDWMPPNADFPAGFAMNLTDTILRLRYREDPSRPKLMEPGKRTRVRLEAPPIAAIFAPGHRLRLDIMGSNFPRFDINPNSGEPEGQARASRIATTKLHLESAALTLHVLPQAEDLT